MPSAAQAAISKAAPALKSVAAIGAANNLSTPSKTALFPTIQHHMMLYS